MMPPIPHNEVAGIQTHRPGCKGFTLIETLVAMVVLTVGMLGVSLLNVEGLRVNRAAVHRARAIGLAADMAERIRASAATPEIMLRCTTGRANCNGARLADTEAREWLQEVAAQLPDGTTATILAAPTAANGASINRYDVTLRWPDTGRSAWASYTLTLLSRAQ